MAKSLSGNLKERSEKIISKRRRVIDYSFKQKVLQEHKDIITRQKQSSFREYFLSYYGVDNGGESYADLICDCHSKGLIDVLQEAERINHAEFARIKRLKDRIETLLQEHCIFVTLTFTDDVLKTTTEKERRTAVSRFFKKCKGQYVANIDFGADETKTMREHYHCVIQCKKVPKELMDYWSDKYGYIYCEHIWRKKNDIVKLAKYVSKLTNHAIKENARRSALIYSR